jgi:hypothetical protein
MEHPTWTEQLPEAMRTEDNYKIFDGYEKLGDFTSDFLKVKGDMSSLSGERDDLNGKVTSLNERIGTMVAIPTDESSEEDKKAFYGKFGVPESIDDYGLADLAANDTGKDVLENFKKANLSKAQAKQMTKFITDNYNSQIEAAQVKSNEAVTKYKTDLGDRSELHFKLATDAIAHFFPTDDVDAAAQAIMSDPKQIAVFSKIGTHLKERPGIFASSKATKGKGYTYESMKDLD